jgi:hypothetical protein
MNTKRPKPRGPVPLGAFLCVLLAGGYLAWAEARRHAGKADHQALTNLEEEVEATQLARIAAMTDAWREAKARGEDDVAAVEKFLQETREAYREGLKGIYAKHGRQPPRWLRDPQSLTER